MMAPKQDEHGQWWFEGERVYLVSHPEWKEQFLKRHEVKPNE
jgi:hypothetical protein